MASYPFGQPNDPNPDAGYQPQSSYPAPPTYGAPGYEQPQYGQPQYGQQPQYAQPQNGQPQYAQQPPYGQPQPPGYPPYAGYPPGYPAYGYPAPAGAGRPGLITAAAVIAFVNAGLLIFVAIFAFAGASVVSSYDDNYYNDTSGVTSKVVLLGIGNMILGAIYITAGVRSMGGSQIGRVLYFVGAGVSLVLGIIWLQWSGVALIFWAMLFWTLSVLSCSFVIGGRVGRWFAASAAAQPR
jgi:hypothetical protein